MSKERIQVVLDIAADVGKIEGSLSSLRGSLANIQLPKGIGRELENRMSKLSDEIKNFQNLASKAGNSFEGAKQIDASYKRIVEYARKVENSFSAIKDEAKIDASKFFPKDVLDRIEKAENAMADYYKAIEKGNDSLKEQRKNLKDIETALDKNKKKQGELLAKQSGKKASRDEIVKEQTKIKVDKTADLSKEQKSLEILNKRKIALEAEKTAVDNLIKKKEALEKAEKTYSSRKAQYGAKDSKAKGEKVNFDAAKKAYNEAEEAAKQYGDTIRSISDIEIDQSKVAADIKTTESAIKGLGKEIENADAKIKKADNAYDNLTKELKENEAASESFKQQIANLKTEIEKTENAAKAEGLKTLAKTLSEIGIKVDPAVNSLEDIQNTINNLKPEAIQEISSALDKAGVNIEELGVSLEKVGDKNKTFQEGAKGVKQMNDQMEQLKGQVQQFFSLTNSVMLFRRGVQQAIETVKELDAAMTETAVVTDFSVGDMWEALPRYTQTANDLGTTTLGAYETMTLFYQQGLETNEVFEVGTETMKMARIAGLDYADATNLMTAALRGFNMELNETSATRINDVYSELAAITAADTNEIATAMTKTASIANSANMEFETTAALLSQIIETTREPAETAGTALKTIIARFTEMKKSSSEIINVDGEEVNVNKVEAALKSAGVALRDAKGEFRDLDDVFLELSSKWNGLDIMTQRYVATMAAGSRQQSRFIAMMQDYDRTIELVNAAYNSSGASQKQFEKTQDSLESKINKLKNAWNEFLMGISNSKVIKAGVDALTGLLNIVNKLTGKSGIAKLGVAIGALKGGSAIFNGLLNFISPLKGQMGKTGEDIGTSFLQGIAQKILNFNAGKGFVLDVNVGEKGILGLSNNFKKIKQDFLSLVEAMKTPLVRDDTTLIFEKIDDKIVATGMTTKGVTTKINGELSQTAMQALAASEGVEEIGEDFVKTGMSGKTALDLIQKEYLETIALAEALDKANDGDVVEFSGDVIQGKFTASDSSRQFWKGRGDTLGKDVKTLESGGTTFLGSLTKILPLLIKIAAVIGAIAATAYVLYNTSSLKKVQNEIETMQGAIEDCGRAIEKTQEALNGFNSILSELENRDSVFDTLIEGSSEWYNAIADSNQLLLEQIELLQALGYDIDYFYDKNGKIEVKNKEDLRKGQEAASKQQIALQKKETAMMASREVIQLKQQLLEKNSETTQDNFVDAYFQGVADASKNTDTLMVGPNATPDEFARAEIGAGFGSAIADVISPELTKEQIEELNQKSKESAATIWQTYAETEAQMKAGLKILQNTENAYDNLFSDNVYEIGFEKKFQLNNFANPELEYKNKEGGNGKDIKKSELDTVIKDLGYADWNEVATVLGIEWDKDIGGYKGLYTVDDEDSTKKNYLKVSNHGSIDDVDEFSEYLNDPSSKNIDAGYLALRLAELKKDEGVLSTIKESTGEYDLSNVLYGTSDWIDPIIPQDSGDTTQAAYKLIAEANQQKRDIYQSLLDITATEDDATKALFNTADNIGNVTTESLQNFASEIQRISVDANEITAESYKAFITSQFASKLEKGENANLDEIQNTYQELFDGLDLSNATNSINALNQKINEGIPGAKELKESLISTGTITLSDTFSELYLSGILNELGEDISKLSDEAGNIDVTATRELVDSNSELKTIMDDFNVSGYAMGKILTDIQNGEIKLTDINNGLIESYKLLYSAMGQAEDVLYDLRNADLGEDYTEIGRTYEERFDTIKDLYDRKAYGSENFAGNIKSLIGEDAWDQYLIANNGSIKGAWEDISSDYKLGKNNGNLYGSMSSLISANSNDIFSNSGGKIAYDLSGFETYDQVLDHMVESFGVSREYAKAMLADMSTYSDTLQEDLNKLNSVANANQEYQKMYHVNEKDEQGNEKTVKSYTNMSDIKIARIFKDTKEWDTAKKTAKEAYNKEKGDGAWDTLELQEQTNKITEAFKTATNIINTIEVDENGQKKTYNIQKIDSQGNKFYKDSEGQVQVQKSKAEVKIEVEGQEELERVENLTQNPQVIQAATELNDEEFQAWLSAYTGDENLYTAMIEAGVTPESIASVAKAKDDMITQIQAVAQALETLEVTIPIVLGGGWTGLVDSEGNELLGVNLPGFKTQISIGGKGTVANFVKPYTPMPSTSGAGTRNFGSNPINSSGTGYDGGSDSTNNSKGGGGSGSKDKDDKINYTNPTLENINEKLKDLERRREKGEIDALDYENEKKGLLGLKQGILQADLDKALANSQYKKYFGYDKETDSILLNETEFNKLTNDKKDAVMEEYERIKGINDELNAIEDEIGEYAANANTVDAINAALEAIERKYENKDLNAIEYIRERDALLSKKAIILQATLDDELANNTEKRFFYYDEVLDAVLLNEEEFNKLSEDRQEEVRKEYEKIKSINDELNEIEDTLKDMEFRSPEDRQQYQLGEAMNWNAQGDLDSINRKRDELGRYDELIGKLPSEMQGPLTLMTGGMNMLYEAEESQVLRRQEEALRMELEAKERNAQYLDNGINDPNEAIYYYDPTTKSYKIHEDRFAQLKTQEERNAVMDEIEKMKGYVDAINEVQTQRSGGIFQKPFYLAEKSAKAMQKAFKNTGNTAKDVKDAFNDLEKALGLSETALDKFEGGLTEAIEQSGLKDKEIKGLGLLSDEQFNKLNNSKLGGFMGDNSKAFAQMLLGEGSTNGMDFANTGLGALSEMFGFTGDLMNFDMMGMGLDMLNTGKGMIEQGMQMVEKIIGYITQAVQVVVDAWTNREDYLYNFLQIIEKHLRDYEKLQREQNQIEKGRYASVDDIKENWDAQWKSLQTQLEEQTERLETRQKELERSRWNPFSLISGWDPSTDTLYENRTVKFAWDLFIGFGSMAPMGLGSLFGSLNQLYEDYDKRVQNSYEDRLAAEQAILDIEDQRLELVKAGSEQATEFEQRVMDAMVQKEQEQIEELTRLNDTISEANSKLIETLRSNLEKMRQERENEKTEEELGEKERRLAYLRQDTSGANMMEIKKLEEQLEEGHESYTDKLIDQKISELEDQNDKAAEQRQKQIDLLQGQLDYAEKYGLYWDKIYGMLYTFDENGNAILNPDNFDLDGNIRKNSELDKLLGTFSDRIGMSAWSTVLDAEELDYLGKYYGAFIEYNGVTGDWKNAWALRDPGAADPNYAYPEQEIPDGLWGALYRLEIALKKNSIHNNPDIINRGGRLEESFKNFFGKLFGNEEWANYEYEPTSAAHVQSTFFAGMKEDLDGIKAWFSGGTSNVSRNAKNLSINSGGTQNYGDSNVNNYFNIGSVGESISLDDMANRVANIFKDMFSTGNNVLRNGH